MSIVSKNLGIVAICVGTVVTGIAILRANDGPRAGQKRRAIQKLEGALDGQRPAGFTTNHINATSPTIQLDDICELRFLKGDLERANAYLQHLVDRRDEASDDPGSYKAELSDRFVREWEQDVNFLKEAIAKWYDRHQEEANALEGIGDKQAAERKRQGIRVLMALGSEISASVSAFPAGPWMFGQGKVAIQPGREFAIQQRQAELRHSKGILRRLVADQQRLVVGQETRYEEKILWRLIWQRETWINHSEAAIRRMDEAYAMEPSRAGPANKIPQHSNTGAMEPTGTDPDGAVTGPGTSDSTAQAKPLELNQVLTELREQVQELRREVGKLRELLEKKP